MASGSQVISSPVRKPSANRRLAGCAARRAASTAASTWVNATRVVDKGAPCGSQLHATRATTQQVDPT